MNAEANAHSADWLMRAFVNELGSQSPAPCTQSTRSVRAAVPKDYERDFKSNAQTKNKKKISMEGRRSWNDQDQGVTNPLSDSLGQTDFSSGK